MVFLSTEHPGRRGCISYECWMSIKSVRKYERPMRASQWPFHKKCKYKTGRPFDILIDFRIIESQLLSQLRLYSKRRVGSLLNSMVLYLCRHKRIFAPWCQLIIKVKFEGLNRGCLAIIIIETSHTIYECWNHSKTGSRNTIPFQMLPERPN